MLEGVFSLFCVWLIHACCLSTKLDIGLFIGSLSQEHPPSEAELQALKRGEVSSGKSFCSMCISSVFKQVYTVEPQYNGHSIKQPPHYYSHLIITAT